MAGRQGKVHIVVIAGIFNVKSGYGDDNKYIGCFGCKEHKGEQITFSSQQKNTPKLNRFYARSDHSPIRIKKKIKIFSKPKRYVHTEN